jgi:threonine synthase
VLARAVEWPLRVFVPTHAEPGILERLRELHAEVVNCARSPGVAGDPCVHRFHEAVRAGAVPFSSQGSEYGLVIDGGETLGYEIVSSLLAEGATPDRLFVQVGGGALASATSQALQRAHEMGLLQRMPRLHAVQTEGGFPLARAWETFRKRFPGPLEGAALEEAVAFAAKHRSTFMQPWPTEPKGLATGILDDETYDWLAVVRAMAASGGHAVVVSEGMIIRAHELARGVTSIAADATGTTGLAGCLALAEAHELSASEQHVVLFTGAERA